MYDADLPLVSLTFARQINARELLERMGVDQTPCRYAGRMTSTTSWATFSTYTADMWSAQGITEAGPGLRSTAVGNPSMTEDWCCAPRSEPRHWSCTPPGNREWCSSTPRTAASSPDSTARTFRTDRQRLSPLRHRDAGPRRPTRRTRILPLGVPRNVLQACREPRRRGASVLPRRPSRPQRAAPAPSLAVAVEMAVVRGTCDV